TYMTNTGQMKSKTFRPHRISLAKGTNYCTFYNASNQYWVVTPDLTLLYGTTTNLTDYPFELIPADIHSTGISPLTPQLSPLTPPIYDLMGRPLPNRPVQGLYIQGGKKYLAK
ncbi:MAG: hypothetical protein K2H04_03925, partial [Bacteroidaceae bacterium]|nr:hypothetical protein [Bacteroidaceae bacterium]